MRHLIKLISPFFPHICVMMAISLVPAMDMTIKPYCIKWIIDSVNTMPKESDVWSAIQHPILTYMTLSCFVFFAYRVWGYVIDIRMIPALRQHLCLWGVDQLMRHPYPFFQQHFTGALSQKIQDIVSSVPDFIEILVGRFLVVSFTIVIGVIALMNASPVFGWIMIVWTFFFLMVSWWTTPVLAKLASHWAHAGSKVVGSVVDWMTNISSTIIFGHQLFERNIIKQKTTDAVEAEHKQQWVNFWVSTCLSLWTIMAIALTLFLLVDYRQKKLISVGDFALVLSINTTLIHQVWQVNGECSRFARLWGRIQQAIESLLSPQNIHDSPLNFPTSLLQDNSLHINNLSFQYESSTQPVLNNLNLIIPANQKIGIVGTSGSGKSTLIHVLLRLFECQKGTIHLGHVCSSKISADVWRSHIGFIPQDSSLFHRSLLDNIRYGNVNATEEDVIQASKKAKAHNFITKLDDGYHTLVGERGVKISGGQRQRIAIARAVLKNAPVLILDEATSQLDSLTENSIQDSLFDIMKNKTTIVVAHRLSTLLRMDRIVVMSHGRIVEDGTHEELLAQNGQYATLWNAQIGDFLGDPQI